MKRSILTAVAMTAVSIGVACAQSSSSGVGSGGSQSVMPPTTGSAQGVQPPNAVPGGTTSNGQNAKNYFGAPNTGSVVTGNPAADGNKAPVPQSK